MSDKCCKTTEACTDEPTQITNTGEINYDGNDLTCVGDETFSATAGDKLNGMLSLIWSKVCALSNATTDYISNVVRSGSDLTFTGQGSAFNGTIDLTKQTYKVNRGTTLDIVDNTSASAITGMEITGIAAGTYLVGFSANISLDLGGTAAAYPNGLVGDQGSAAYNVNGTFSVYNGGVQVTETEVSLNTDVGFASYENDGLQLFPNSSWIITVSEGATVDLRWNKGSASTDVILNLLNSNLYLMEV